LLVIRTRPAFILGPAAERVWRTLHGTGDLLGGYRRSTSRWVIQATKPLEALNTGLGWNQGSHAAGCCGRALAEAKKDVALLLRGDELEDTERWLARNCPMLIAPLGFVRPVTSRVAGSVAPDIDFSGESRGSTSRRAADGPCCCSHQFQLFSSSRASSSTVLNPHLDAILTRCAVPPGPSGSRSWL